VFSLNSLRARWLWLHRWLGLFLLLFCVPIGLTGSINVYHREIDRWLYPALYEPRSQGPALPLESILRSAQQHHPGEVISLILPDAYWPVLLIHQRRGTQVWRMAFDPASGQFLGERNQSQALLPTLYRLHQHLLLKPYWGEELVGIVGIALSFSCLSGLWLWRPQPRHLWKSLGVRWRGSVYRFQWELHSAGGFWVSLIMLGVALSGVALVFPSLLSPLAPRVVKPTSVKARGPLPAADPDAVLGRVRQLRPDLVPLVLVLPTPRLNLWRVALRPAGHHGTVGGMEQLWIDPWTLNVQEYKSPGGSVGDLAMAWRFPLHNGSLLGEGGRFLVFLSGLALPMLGLTGAYLWNYRRVRRRPRRTVQVGPQISSDTPTE